MRKAKLLKVVLLLVAVTVSVQSSAQEFVRELHEQKDTKTLLREIGMNHWLMYQHYGTNGWSSFCVVDASGTTYPLMAFTDCLDINDFEIINKKIVYFCGTIEYCLKDESGDKLIERSSSSAVFGYFNLEEILTPSGSSVNCVKLDHFGQLALESLDKLEVMNVPDGVHVFMTGSAQNGEGLILDAAATTHFPSSWDLYFDLSLNGEAFDDIALLENYIVVTSRFPNTATGVINLFHKPLSYSSSTLSSTVYRGEVCYGVNDTLLVTHCEREAFSTGTFSSSEGGLVISGYNFSTPIYSIVLDNNTDLAPNLQLRDIRYNKNSQVLDVLQQVSYMAKNDNSSIIWHLDQTLSAHGILNNCHKFRTTTLHSIACLENNPGRTAGSGHDNGQSPFALLTHVELGYNGSCSETDIIKYHKLYHILTANSLSIANRQATEIPSELGNSLFDWSIINKCTDDNQ